MKFRYARHTNRLSELVTFYTAILGFSVLGKFEAHEKYNGVFLGKEGLDWHLEFTESDELPEHSFDGDDVLVFYPSNAEELQQIKQQIKKSSIEIVQAKNPYWNRNAYSIKDPDGHTVVISEKFIENSRP